MNENFTKFAFTESVKAEQEKRGSRKSYARMENSGDRFVLKEAEKEFIETRDSFYMATVGENGWPYVQFRGGPPGFLKVLDDSTIGFADFRGNRQYISTGNIIATGKASLILMDYPKQERLKIWTETEIHEVDADSELAKRVALPDYKAVVERIMVMRVRAYDWNCPQHITPRYTHEQISDEIERLSPDMVKSCCLEEE